MQRALFETVVQKYFSYSAAKFIFSTVHYNIQGLYLTVCHNPKFRVCAMLVGST